MNRARQVGWALLLTVLGVTALWAWPWSRDLIVQIITRPQQYANVPPPGSIPISWEAPLAREVASGRLQNPLSPSAQALDQGKQLYETYCLVCHGREGRGNGPVAGGALLPTDLTSAQVRARTDGYLYGTIRHGGGLMPSYGERLTPRERWLVVGYVRTLEQKRGP